MRESRHQQVASRVGTLLLVVLVLLLWELLAREKLIDLFFFSQPTAILNDLVKLFVSGEIWPHVLITLQETLMGLVIGTAVGIILAFVFGVLDFVARVLDPIVVALYGIPKLALAPMFILWFGLGVQAKILMATLMVFFLAFFNAYAGFRSVEPSLINTVKLMGANRVQVMVKVVFPSCLPWIMAGLRAGLGAALLGAIAGEYLGARQGLGWMVVNAGGMYDITRVFSAVLVLVLIITTMNAGLKLLEKRVLRWRPSDR